MYRDKHSELDSNAWMMLPVEFLLGFLGKTALMSHYGSGFRVAEREEALNSAITIEIEVDLKRFPRAEAVVFSSVSRCQCYTEKRCPHMDRSWNQNTSEKKAAPFFFISASRCSWWKRGESECILQGKCSWETCVLHMMKQHNWVVTDSGLTYMISVWILECFHSFFEENMHSHLPFPD